VYTFGKKDFGEEGDAPLELAYAITVHKAQGSEFGTVIVVLPDPCRVLSRELLYTALTRQKDRVVLLVQGERDEEPAQGEGSFGVGQWPVVVPEAVGVPVAGEVGQVTGQGRDGARVRGFHAAAERRQQQRGVQRRVLRGALPPPVGVHRVGCGVGGDLVGQGEPLPDRGAGVREPGDGPQPGDADQPAVCPRLVVDFPDPGVGFGPPGGDGGVSDPRGPARHEPAGVPPLPVSLVNLPNLLSTPHIGGSSEEAILAMGLAAIDGLENAGDPIDVAAGRS
jgi:hypothetical protein